MNIFNSLGSNYKLSFAINTLFLKGSKIDKKNLVKILEDKYNGKVYLFYKGREAIETCLRSLSLNSDSEIAINGFTCYAVYNAIENANLVPFLIDIEKDNLNFSFDNLKKGVQKNRKIKAVIVQNTLGYSCDIERISKFCKENNLILIEDLAHSAGSNYANNSEAGKFGDFVILSFSQDKIIDGISGGALIIRNKNYNIKLEKTSTPNPITQLKDRLYPVLTYKIRFLYKFGLGRIYHFLIKNLNLLSKPMDDINNISTLPNWYCKIVHQQILNLNSNISHRKRIATIYNDNLSKELLINEVSKSINLSTNLRFPILVENRKSIVNKLKQNGVYVSDIWYDAPISPKRYMQKVRFENNCPNSEYISERILNLPTHLNISGKDALKITEIINSWQK